MTNHMKNQLFGLAECIEVQLIAVI